MSGSIQFAGYSVTSIKSDCGWGSSESSLSLGLVVDPGNIAFGVSADAGPDLSLMIGLPATFAMSSGFSFQGILENFSQNGSQSGLPLYDAKLVDPRFILSNYTIICKDYLGVVTAPNVFNVYGALGYTGSSITPSGMYFDIIRLGISQYTNNPGANVIFGGAMMFAGVRYAVDLSEIPNSYITINDFQQDLLSMVSSVCTQLGLDFFVELNGYVIKIRTVSIYDQVSTSALQDFIVNGSGNNVSSFSRGISIAKDATTSRMIVGPNQEFMYFPKIGSRYYGKDFNGLPIFGQPALITLFMSSLNDKPLPTTSDNDVDWKVTQGGEKPTQKSYGILTEIVPVLIKDNTLARLLGTNIFTATLYELEFANEIKSGKGDGDGDLGEYLKKYRYSVYVALGGSDGRREVARDDGFAFLLQKERRGLIQGDDLEDNIKLFIDALAETYGHMGFAYPVGDEILVRQEYGKLQFSREAVGSAWFPEWEAGLVTFNDGYNINQLISSDMRFKPFLISGVKVDKSIGWSAGGYVVPSDGGAEMILGNPANQADFGYPYMDGQSFITNEGCIYRYDTSMKKFPYPVWNTPMAVLKSDTIDQQNKLVSMGRPGFGTKFKPPTIQDAPNNPLGAGIPVKDLTQSYGPWAAVGNVGKTQVDLDSQLTPWNWGSTRIMNDYARQTVANSLSKSQLNEEGDLTITGLPTTEFGNIMQFVGVSISAISITIDSKSGYSTTYRFRRFSPKFGTFNQTRINQIKNFSDTVKDVKSRILETVSATDYDIAQLRLSARIGLDALNRVKRKQRNLKLNSPHIWFMSATDITQTDNGNPTIITKIQTGDSDDAERFLYGRLGPTVNTAAMSLDGLIRPYYNYYGSVGEIPKELENVGEYLPALTDPQNTGSYLNTRSLNPFGTLSDVACIYANTFNEGQNKENETLDLVNLKPFALRGPLMLSGWGFDRYTLQAVPKVGKDRISEPYPSSQDNKELIVQQTNSFKTGPVDLVWDEGRGVWTNNSVATFSVEGTGLVKTGEFGSGYIYSNFNGSKLTKLGTPVVVKIFNGSGKDWSGTGINPIKTVMGLFDANLNTWFGVPIELSASGQTEDVPYIHSVTCSGSSLVIEKKVMKFKNGLLKEVVASGSGTGTTTTTLTPTTTTPGY
jgi:hypothetical protein